MCMQNTITILFFVACVFSNIFAAEFEDPVRIEANGKPIRIESPGYASPCWADANGDGKKELLVGQFNGGNIRVFVHEGGMKFAKGLWLMSKGKAATVPGIG